MNPYDAHKLALKIIEEHCPEYSFKFDNAKKRAGCCNYTLKRISISKNLLQFGEEEVRQTLLHEAAHAMVGPGHHHDHVWKRAARSIGCNGERCHSLKLSEPMYTISCEPCGVSWKRHRVDSRFKGGIAICARCYGKFTIKKNVA